MVVTASGCEVSIATLPARPDSVQEGKEGVAMPITQQVGNPWMVCSVQHDTPQSLSFARIPQLGTPAEIQSIVTATRDGTITSTCIHQ